MPTIMICQENLLQSNARLPWKQVRVLPLYQQGHLNSYRDGRPISSSSFAFQPPNALMVHSPTNSRQALSRLAWFWSYIFLLNEIVSLTATHLSHLPQIHGRLQVHYSSISLSTLVTRIVETNIWSWYFKEFLCLTCINYFIFVLAISNFTFPW